MSPPAEAESAKEAWVTLKDIGGRTFMVDSSFFDPEKLISMRTRAKFAYLINALLASRGTHLDDFTFSELIARFPVSEPTLREGIRELGGGDGDRDSSLD